ncbi:MAG: hypothetical protein AB8H12_02730 [Lewinella sp.]
MSIFGVLNLLERLKGRFFGIFPLFVMRGFVAAGVFGIFCERPPGLGEVIRAWELGFGGGLITQTPVIANKKIKSPIKLLSKKKVLFPNKTNYDL